ncbi:MAG: NAD(P)/FAD-dependent oxidoreductase [Myxococcales bacterium]|nr:NAD(P)/FAD-dependent oxidoreductase [Myxococcales bacterium]
MSGQPHDSADLIIVGGGHNALCAAVLLARAGLSVRVLEARGVIGGATRTEHPFERAPGLGVSTGAYLLGLMPPELIAELGVELPVLRRDPHYFLPTRDGRYLLFGADEAATEQQMLERFSAADLRAHRALQRELSALREDLAPAWLQEPRSLEETAERHMRPELRQVFIDLCRGSVGAYLERFGFRSELLKAMYAVTDGFSGLCGGWDTPGTGHNFLVHNMCRLPGAGGTWMVVEGGMGTVARVLRDAAERAGARIETGAEVVRVRVEEGVTRGVELSDGRSLSANAVLVGSDPFTLADLVPQLPDTLAARIEAMQRPGTTLKVNLALRELPTFRCLPEDRGQFRTTIHILPEEGGILEKMNAAFEAAMAGELPEEPMIEWYTHTVVDPSLRDDAGRHSAALFVQWVPHTLASGSWDTAIDGYVERLLGLCDQLAPNMSDVVEDSLALHPQAIEARFGMRGGHIHHVDNTLAFDARMPYDAGVPGLYACGAGCHPAGSVIGLAGRNAAHRVLRDLGVAS